MGAVRRWRIGVDEAGRGSLVGEMMVAAYAVEAGRLGELVEAGVADSKELTPRARRELYFTLARLGRFVVVPVPPEDIDRLNLNLLTARAVARAVGLLARLLPGPVESVVIDRFGDPVAVASHVRRAGVRAPVYVEERADSRYPEVSAASIVAKHVRDSRIRVLRSLYGVRGSGYPSDPETVSWVLDVVSRGERPRVIRYSWATLKGTRAYRPKVGRARSRTLDDFLG